MRRPTGAIAVTAGNFLGGCGSQELKIDRTP